MGKPAKELKAFGKTALLQSGESQALILTWNVMGMASFFADIRCIVTQKVAKARKDKANDAMKLLLS